MMPYNVETTSNEREPSCFLDFVRGNSPIYDVRTWNEKNKDCSKRSQNHLICPYFTVNTNDLSHSKIFRNDPILILLDFIGQVIGPIHFPYKLILALRS